MRRAMPLLTMLTILSGLSLAAQGSPAEADSIAITLASRAMSAAYVGNDSVAVGQVYSDSALLLPPGRQIRGRLAIQRYFTWGPGHRQVAHAMKSTNLSISGNLAFDVGTWTSTSQRGDGPVRTASERYLVVWVREADGRWRILYDMWHRQQP